MRSVKDLCCFIHLCLIFYFSVCDQNNYTIIKKGNTSLSIDQMQNERVKRHRTIAKNNVLNILIRTKRYLVYPKGSAILISAFAVKSIITRYPTGYNLLAGVDLLYTLPDKPRYFIKKNITTTQSSNTTTTTVQSIPVHNNVIIESNPHKHKETHWNDNQYGLLSGWNSENIPYVEHPSPSNSQKLFSNERLWNYNQIKWRSNFSHLDTNQLQQSEVYLQNRKYNKHLHSKWQPQDYATTWRSFVNNNSKFYNKRRRSANNKIQRRAFNIEDYQDWKNYHSYKDRLGLYQYIEDIFKHKGFQARFCLLRAICEAKTSLLPKGLSLIHDLIRLFFSIPIKNQMNDDYSNAMRSRNNGEDCWNIYEKDCPISILDLFIKSKRIF